MDGVTLLRQARDIGIEVRADGEKLHVRGPKRHESLVKDLFEHKAELLQLLRSEAANDKLVPCPVCGDVETWPTTKGPVCPTCWLASRKPEPVST